MAAQRAIILEIVGGGETLLFNELSPTGKHAALSLKGEGAVTIREDEKDGLIVENRKPRHWVSTFTAGMVR